RRSPRPELSGAPHRAAAGDDGALRAVDAAGVRGARRCGALLEPDPRDVQWRGIVRPPGAAALGAVESGAALQPLWSDRGHGGCDDLEVRTRTRRRGDSDWAGDIQYADVHPRRGRAPGAARGSG